MENKYIKTSSSGRVWIETKDLFSLPAVKEQIKSIMGSKWFNKTFKK